MRPLVVVVLLGLARAAAAQTPVADDPAFSVERFTPAPGRAAFAVVEDPDVLPHLAWSAGLWTSLSRRPIVFRDLVTDEVATVPVDWRLAVEAHGALGLGTRYQLGVALPWAVQDGDRLQGIGVDETALARVVLGDLRLHARARIAGRPGDPGFAAALAGALVLPTGDDDHFAGEAGPVLEWKLALGWRGARAAVAANLGVRLRTEEVILLSPARPHGNELAGGLAGELALPWLGRALPAGWAVAEATGILGDSIGNGTRGPSPAELRAGLRLALTPAWSLTALAGGGLTPDSVGSPRWRLALALTFDCPPPRCLTPRNR